MSSRRIESVDILRGATIAFMVLVNNPGSWKAVYPPLVHSAWNGLTPCDCIFPTFLFVMGVSMYLSLRKGGFTLSWKMLKRTLLLLGIGLVLNYVSQVVYDNNWSLSSLRIPGVLQRFALCYGITALLVCRLPHRALPWTAGGLLILYGALLLVGNGYEYGAGNINARFDRALLGEGHLYPWDNGVDPEGLLSTLPAIAHTLVGFLVGGWLSRGDNRRIAVTGAALVLAGAGLSFLLPLNKKIWSPSFVFVTCGIASLLLAMLYFLVDEKHIWRQSGFFKVFGTNAIFCYVLADVLAWIFDRSGLHTASRTLLGETPLTSLLYAFFCVIVVWLLTLPLYRRKVFLKL